VRGRALLRVLQFLMSDFVMVLAAAFWLLLAFLFVFF
jgi:hypothetical protein